MEFALSEEQSELASIVRAVLTKQADSAAVRSAAASPLGYDEALWETLCEQVGVAALGIPEEYDGAGASFFETAVVLEELGRSLAPSPLLATAIATEALLAGGTDDAKTRLLPRISTGDIATLVLPSVAPSRQKLPSSRQKLPASRQKLPASRQKLSDGSASVSDSSASVSGGWAMEGAQAAVLLAVVGDDLVEVDPAMVAITPVGSMDQTVRLAQVDLGSARHVVIGDGSAARARAELVASAGVSALAVGLCDRALRMTVDYSQERVQFGRPIGSFQALKHRMAEMLVRLELARSASWAASYAVSRGTDDAADLSRAAASYTLDAADHLAGECVQLHGGIAITWEHDAHLVLKRAHALRQLAGPPHRQRAAVDLF